MAITISSMTERDVDGAIECIQQAFASGDPYADWVFDRSNFSPERNKASLGLRCRWGIQHALFQVAKDASSETPDKVLGVAMWLPPSPANAPRSWSAYFGAWQLWFGQVYTNLRYGRGGLNTTRYWIWKARQAEAQSAIWTDAEGYWFCNIVTIRPEEQGRGIGRKLMEGVLDRADEEGRRCYLESSRREPNVPIYERMGFELVKEMECEEGGDGCKLYCMVREPRSANRMGDSAAG